MICKINPARFEVGQGHLVSVSEKWIDRELSIHEEYAIYAIGVYNGVTKILIDPSNNGRPVWYSLNHFVISDSVLTNGWEMFYNDEADWSLIIGYNKLVRSEDHFNGILERNEMDLKKFAEFESGNSGDMA